MAATGAALQFDPTIKRSEEMLENPARFHRQSKYNSKVKLGIALLPDVMISSIL